MTNYEKAVEIYEMSGQYGVYHACRNGNLNYDSWLKCIPCETFTPFEDSCCLVCGTTKEEIEQEKKYA